MPELGFRIGFNTGQPRRIRRSCSGRAEPRINNIPPDPEFRNQQVAGSIPAGGSIFSILYRLARYRIGFKWVQFAGVSEPLGFFFNN